MAFRLRRFLAVILIIVGILDLFRMLFKPPHSLFSTFEPFVLLVIGIIVLILIKIKKIEDR